MATFKMNCPWCEQKIEVDDKSNDTIVECPSCKKNFIAANYDSDEMPQLKISSGKTKKNKMPLGKRILWTVAGTIAVIFIILSIVLYNSTFAQMCLAYCYAEGLCTVSKNPSKALKLMSKAAERGEPEAQWAVGEYYLRGFGVERNYSEAIKWLRKSVEQGHPGAMETLGMCYEEGLGVEKNLSEAIAWYRKAAELGNEKAKEALNRTHGIKKNEI